MSVLKKVSIITAAVIFVLLLCSCGNEDNTDNSSEISELSYGWTITEYSNPDNSGHESGTDNEKQNSGNIVSPDNSSYPEESSETPFDKVRRKETEELRNNCVKVYNDVNSAKIKNGYPCKDGKTVDWAFKEGIGISSFKYAARKVTIDDVQSYYGTNYIYKDVYIVISSTNRSEGSFIYSPEGKKPDGVKKWKALDGKVTLGEVIAESGFDNKSEMILNSDGQKAADNVDRMCQDVFNAIVSGKITNNTKSLSGKKINWPEISGYDDFERLKYASIVTVAQVMEYYDIEKLYDNLYYKSPDMNSSSEIIYSENGTDEKGNKLKKLTPDTVLEELYVIK